MAVYSSARSFGIGQSARSLVRELVLRNHAAELMPKARETPGHLWHLHYGNSARATLYALLRSKDRSVVSVHDAMPRDPRIRSTLRELQTRALNRHRVIAHSQHAKSLLADQGVSADIAVVPLLLPPAPVERAAVDQLREEWQTGRYERTLVSAGRITGGKGLQELLDAARALPQIQLVLLGKSTNRRSRALLETRSANVRHCRAPDDTSFYTGLAAGDALVSIRRSSVGETSGPVVQAHALGTPVLGLKHGSLPEYCSGKDQLLDASATARDVLELSLTRQLERLQPGDNARFEPDRIIADLISIYETEFGFAKRAVDFAD